MNPLPTGFLPEEMLVDGSEGSIARSGQQQPHQQELELDGSVMDELLEQRIQNVHDLSGIKRVIQELSLDLRREPGFSQLIFSHLLENDANIEDFQDFLKDPSLNVNGAGNFLCLVEYLQEYETSKKVLHGYFTLMHQALRLGLISPEEIALIVKLTPGIRIGSGTLKSSDPECLAFCYKSMWDGIEACSILDSKDLGEETLNLWLGEIAETPPNKATLLLGAQIIRKMVVFSLGSGECCRWVPAFMAQWMSLSTDSVVTDVELNGRKLSDVRNEENLRYISSFLDLFNPELKVKHIIDVTEFLAFSLQGDDFQSKILEGWKLLLPKLGNPGPMLSSPRWTIIEPLSSDLDVATELSPETREFYAHHRCLLRLWVVKTLGMSYGEARDKAIEQAVYDQRGKILNDLMAQFDTLSSKLDDSDIFTNLIHSFQDLQLPQNSIMVYAAKQQTGKPVPRNMYRIFRALEDGSTNLAEVFSNIQTYTSSKPYLLSTFDRMVRNTDITTPSFLQHAIRTAETDEEGRSALLRLFRRHTPLKIALSRAWDNSDSSSLSPELVNTPSLPFLPSTTPPPSTSSSSSTPFPPPTPSTSESSTSPSLPSPMACLELFHILSLAFACSTRLTPRTSFRLVFWCYQFLIQHHAPIKPVVVRALYHAGVTKYREEGWKVTSTRFNLILQLVKEVEGEEVADSLVGKETR